MVNCYKELETLFERYPVLMKCRGEIIGALELMLSCLKNGGKLLVCGNGGSASDSDHIVGELMKEFRIRRPLSDDHKDRLRKAGGAVLAESIRGALPAISLDAHTALSTAVINDVGADFMYAQQVFGYGKKGDVLLGMSTSGNAKNVDYAVKTAKALELGTILLTGEDGGLIARNADIVIRLPDRETYRIQELSLPVYHALCLQLEQCFWGT